MTCLMVACKKTSTEESFYKKAVGVWVPFKSLNSSSGDSLLGWENFHASSIFGVYRESIQFEVDQYFIAVNWADSLNLPAVRSGSEVEGNYTYSSKTRVLSLTSPTRQNDYEWEVVRFDNDELVLFNAGNSLFLKRRK